MYNTKTISTSFIHNTAEFYDKHILLTVVCMPEFGFKLHYFALHLTENGKGF